MVGPGQPVTEFVDGASDDLGQGSGLFGRRLTRARRRLGRRLRLSPLDGVAQASGDGPIDIDERCDVGCAMADVLAMPVAP